MNVLLITNIPAPYRVLQFNEINKSLGDNFLVYYFGLTESNRSWNMPHLSHSYIIGQNSNLSRKLISVNLVRVLYNFKPRIIIASGFTLNIILSFIYAKIFSIKFIILTDSWMHSVSKQSVMHRIIRKVIIKRVDASIAVGNKGKEFLVSYGANPQRIKISPLSIDNLFYKKFYKSFNQKSYDILFSGQFIERKMPFFVIDILEELYKRGFKINFLLIGDGPLKEQILSRLQALGIQFSYPGFIQQLDLPKFYSDSRILLFPTLDDPWGLVANEACAVGTPVITCNNAGAADDLIKDNVNGFVLPLDLNIWVEKIIYLLHNIALYNNFSQSCLKRIQNYSIEKSKLGVLDAIKSCR